MIYECTKNKSIRDAAGARDGAELRRGDDPDQHRGAGREAGPPEHRDGDRSLLDRCPADARDQLPPHPPRQLHVRKHDDARVLDRRLCTELWDNASDAEGRWLSPHRCERQWWCDAQRRTADGSRGAAAQSGAVLLSAGADGGRRHRRCADRARGRTHHRADPAVSSGIVRCHMIRSRARCFG